MIKSIEKYKDLFNKKFLLAVSGGVDSMVMLDLFIQLREKYDLYFEVATFDHLTRKGQSTKDSTFVEETCKANGVICHKASGSMEEFAERESISQEEAGRILRKKFFDSIIDDKKDKDQWLLTLAHNKDDQAETILMRILRGTGIDGIQGMQVFQDKVFRPLLDISKTDIIQYSKDHKIDFVQDSTNYQDIYFRNKVRNNLIPLIENEYSSNIKDNLVNLAKIASLNNDHVKKSLGDLSRSLAMDSKNDYVEFLKADLVKLSAFELTEILRTEIERIKTKYNFTRNHLIEVKKVIESDKKAITVINGLVFYNSQDKFIIRKEIKNQLAKPLVISSDGEYKLNGYILKISELKDQLTIRTRANGDKTSYYGRLKKIKDILIDHKIDAYSRDFIPLVESKGRIVAIGDIYIDKKIDFDLSIYKEQL